MYLSDKDAAELFGGELPEVSPEDEETAKQFFTGYIFYENEPGGRMFECSRCEQRFYIGYKAPLQFGFEWDALHAAHNEVGLCPKCGREVIYKNNGRAKKGTSLRDSRNFVFVYPIGEDECVLLCVNYSRQFYRLSRTQYKKSVNTIYKLSPGFAQRIYTWDYIQWEYTDSDMKSNLLEPFPVGSSYWPNYETYTTIGIERLEKTFLRYAFPDGHTPYQICKYLFKYCTHPQYEMLFKMGLSDIVNRSLDGDDMKRHFDWKEKGKKFFKSISAADIKELCALAYPCAALKGRDFFKKCCKLSLSDAERIYLKYEGRYDGISQLIRRHRINPIKLEKYFMRQDEVRKKEYTPGCWHGAYYGIPPAMKVWIDYIKCAEEIGYDLMQHEVVFPKDIDRAHDDAVAIRNAVKLEVQAKKVKADEEEALKRLETRRKRYEWQEGDFAVIVPSSLREIVKEGQDMQHCVAGYCERHAKGRTTILFIRLVHEPQKSFVTVEMSKNDTIVQCRAFHNNEVSEETKTFVSHYKAWLSENIKQIEKEEAKKNADKRNRRKPA